MSSKGKYTKSSKSRNDDNIVLMKGQSTSERSELRRNQRELYDRIQGNKQAIGDVRQPLTLAQPPPARVHLWWQPILLPQLDELT